MTVDAVNNHHFSSPKGSNSSRYQQRLYIRQRHGGGSRSPRSYYNNVANTIPVTAAVDVRRQKVNEGASSQYY
jgi:hypothetical protein